MNKTLLSAIALLFLFAANTGAQTVKKRPALKSAKAPATKEILLPADYEINVLPADNLGIVLVSISPTPTYPLTNESAFVEFFKDLFGSERNTLLKALNAKRALPKIVIKFDGDDTLLTLVNTVHLVRVSAKSIVELRTMSGDVRLIVSAKVPANEMLDVKPNPLTLIVGMTEQKSLSLNGEDMGKLSDMSALVKRLKDLFREREENGVFRENTNEVETTVFIKLPLTNKADDLIRIAKTLEEAGSDVIGLQVDEPTTEQVGLDKLFPVFPIKNAPSLPKKKPRR